MRAWLGRRHGDVKCRQNSELSRRGLAWGSTGRLIEMQPGSGPGRLSVDGEDIDQCSAGR